LENHAKKIKYSDIADINLSQTLRLYDKKTSSVTSNLIPLSEIPKNIVFLHNGKIFRKGELLRKYILCKNLNNKKMYRCHPLMMVSLIEGVS
jgi:hypothetical protein